MSRFVRSLSLRGRVAFFAPYVLLILVAFMHLAPFAEIESIESVNGEVTDSSNTKLYPDYAENTFYSKNTEDSLEAFGGRTTEKTQLEDAAVARTFFEEIPELGESVDERLSHITALVLLMAIIGFAARNSGRSLRIGTASFSDRRAIQGAIMTYVAVVMLMLVGSIATDFGTLDEDFREAIEEDEEIASFDDGAWGHITSEMTEGGLEQEVNWSPSWLFYIGFLAFLVAILAAIAGLSTLLPGLDIEEAPIWPQGQAPTLLERDFTPIWFGIIVGAVVLAVFSPWYTVDQTWVVNEEVKINEYENTTYELGWSMSPFYVSFLNDTGLFEGGESKTELNIDGYQDRFELKNIAPIMLDLRWPMVFMSLLMIGWCVAYFWPKAKEELGLSRDQTGMMFILGVGFILLLSSNIGGFENTMTEEAGSDLQRLTPVLNYTFSHGDVQDMFRGQSFAVDVDFRDTEESVLRTVTSASMEWGPSFGFLAASALPWLLLGGLASTTVQRVLQRLDEEQDEQEGAWVEWDVWGAKPVMATLVGILLVSTLGAFPLSALNDASSSAPPGMYQWSLDWTSTSKTIDEFVELADGESRTYSMDTVNLNLGNVSFYGYSVACSEGSTGLLTDELDEIEYVVTPPAAADIGAMQLSGVLSCPPTGESAGDGAESEANLPSEEYAPNEETYLSYIEFPNPFEGEWRLEVTASVNGGATPADNDPDVAVQVYISLRGYDGFTAQQLGD